MPRRFYSEEQNNAATQRFYEEYPEREIQQKKEELYNLISEADKQFLGEAKNRQLLQFLSVHVEPRPHDPEWRRLNRTMKASKWLTGGGIVSWILATFLIGWHEVAIAQKMKPSVLGEAEVAQQANAASWAKAVAQLKNAAGSDKEVSEEENADGWGKAKAAVA